jgi:CheY-like chemotaxis protein
MSAQADPDGSGRTHEPVRVLVVEDETLIALDLEDRLAHLGYDVCGFARSGPEAVAAADRLRPDLVLMDIRLAHGTDGVEAAAEIRKRFGIGAIYLTAHNDEATFRRARSTDPHGFVIKPFSVGDLSITLREAVRRLRHPS